MIFPEEPCGRSTTPAEHPSPEILPANLRRSAPLYPLPRSEGATPRHVLPIISGSMPANRAQDCATGFRPMDHIPSSAVCYRCLSLNLPASSAYFRPVLGYLTCRVCDAMISSKIVSSPRVIVQFG